MTPASREGLNRRRGVMIAAVIAGVSALYWRAWNTIFDVWRDVDRAAYTHGFLVLAIAVWLLWRARDALMRREGGAPDGVRRLAVFVGAMILALAWQFAWRAGMQLVAQLLVPILLWWSVLALFGWRTARVAAFPLGYLYFALPIWDVLNPLAVRVTTCMVRLMLTVTGIPAYFEGNLVQVPAGLFEIEGGCSGLHYLIVALSLGALLGEIRGDGWRMRLRWLLVAGVLGMVVNWLRVYIVIVAGHVTHMQHYLVRESHYGFGWWLFAIVVLTLYWLDRRTAIVPRKVAEPRESSTRPLAIGWVVAVIAALAVPTVTNLLLDRRPGVVGEEARVHVSSCAASSATSSWEPRQLRADSTRRAYYDCAGVPVETFAAWYREQYPGKELGGHDNRIQGEAQVTEYDIVRIGGREYSRLQLDDGGERSMMLVAYRAGGRQFSSPRRAQRWYSLRTFVELRSPVSTAVAVLASCRPDCDTARDTLTRFINEGGLP